MNDLHDLIIIGSGPAGLTAAIYAARADLKPLILGGLTYGGLLMTTTLVENYPGFPDGIQGPELMGNMLSQAKKFGAIFKAEDVTKVDFSKPEKEVWVGEKKYLAKSVIIATGSNPRILGLESEKRLWGKGVSSCATCDGAFFREKSVAVIGGGDSAIEEAIFLTKFAKKVYLVHRRDEFRASQIMQERLKQNERVEIIFDSIVKEILGTDRVEGISLENVKSGEITELRLDGVFLAIGHLPNTTIFKDQIELDEKGYVVIYDNTKTSINGIFVAGDVRDHHYQQAITAAGMGCMAALDAEEWLAENSG